MGMPRIDPDSGFETADFAEEDTVFPESDLGAGYRRVAMNGPLGFGDISRRKR